MSVRTKMFQETRYYHHEPGDPPEKWTLLDSTESIDTQIKEWVGSTGVLIQNTSPPGVSQLWMDKDMTTKCIVVAVMVIYTPSYSRTKGEDYEPKPTAIATHSESD